MHPRPRHLDCDTPVGSGCSLSASATSISVTLRREKGHDIDAACGQLRLKTEKSRELSEV